MKVHKSRLERDREAWTQARASLHKADHCGWYKQKWQHQGRRSGKMIFMVVEQVTCMPVHVSRQAFLHHAVNKPTALACICNPKPGLLSLPGGSSAYTWSLDAIRDACSKCLSVMHGDWGQAASRGAGTSSRPGATASAPRAAKAAPSNAGLAGPQAGASVEALAAHLSPATPQAAAAGDGGGGGAGRCAGLPAYAKPTSASKARVGKGPALGGVQAFGYVPN